MSVVVSWSCFLLTQNADMLSYGLSSHLVKVVVHCRLFSLEIAFTIEKPNR